MMRGVWLVVVLALLFGIPASAHLWAARHDLHVLTAERRRQIIAAYVGHVHAQDVDFDGTAPVRMEDFMDAQTRNPCPPVTWAELLALMDRDSRP